MHLSLLLLLACASTDPPGGDGATDAGTDGADSGAGASSFRAVFIADTHVISPQYECCSESDGVDNESIMKTPDRLRSVVDKINALDPAPDMVFILGDVMHAPYWSSELSWYQDHDTVFSRTQEILGELQPPLYLAWGNHDYDVDCGHAPEVVKTQSDHSIAVDRELSNTLFDAFFAQPPYQVVDHGGWRFILGNGMLGPTWDALGDGCATGLSSYGAEQLAWIDGLLSDGKPTFFMTHHPIYSTKIDEQPGDGNPDLGTVLARHDNVEMMMAGHTHRWIDAGDANPFPHIVIAATRYDDDNFWVVEFQPGETVDTSQYGAGYEILDYDKPVWSTTCADTWVYDGEIGPDPSDPAELGDCSF
ncbi:MAG: metallophosphoesterase [Alphaproteobacteria bacterium]|nr:metallophosphoesterase [Alphaproteobacteria bacterium]